MKKTKKKKVLVRFKNVSPEKRKRADDDATATDQLAGGGSLDTEGASTKELGSDAEKSDAAERVHRLSPHQVHHRQSEWDLIGHGSAAPELNCY